MGSCIWSITGILPSKYNNNPTDVYFNWLGDIFDFFGSIASCCLLLYFITHLSSISLSVLSTERFTYMFNIFI